MNDRSHIWKNQLKYFLLGIGSASAILFLSGSSDHSGSSINFGRYQLSTWATQVNNSGGVVGAFVMDKVSGETKTVYMRSYGDVGKGVVVKNDLKKSFSSMD